MHYYKKSVYLKGYKPIRQTKTVTMKKALKWIGIILGSLIVIIGIVLAFLIIKANNMLNESFDVQPEAITLPTDSASLARGKMISVAICGECHGLDLSGKLFFDEPVMAVIKTPNLTSGEGGIGAGYKNIDWVRAIRHGVDRKGRGLFLMPSIDLNNVSKNDLAAIIAYMNSLPPVDQEIPAIKYGIMGKILTAVGAFGDVIAAAHIDHEKDYNPEPVIAPNAAYGEYVVNMFGCRTCHGPDLHGGPSPDPNSPVTTDISPSGILANWNLEDFRSFSVTGITKEEKVVDNKFMPWSAIGRLDDTEITAIWEYLQTIPPKEDS